MRAFTNVYQTSLSTKFWRVYGVKQRHYGEVLFTYFYSQTVETTKQTKGQLH